jgi:uncharacterized RDD family membrane protein YckC
MNQDFYIAEKGQQLGPFSYEDLQVKGINPETLVWTAGLDNWTKAEHVSLLKDILRSTPPPIPVVSDYQEKKQEIPPIPKLQKEEYFGYTLASRTERFFASLIETIIFLVPLLLIFGTNLFAEENSFNLLSIIGYAIIPAILGAIFYSRWSGNLGHKILGLKVISAIDGFDQKSALKGAVREGLKSMLSNFIIPVIWLLWDSDKQNLYDKVVKTLVVKKSLNEK